MRCVGTQCKIPNMSGPFRTVLGWPFVIAWSSHRTMWLSFCLCLCFQAQFCLSSANAMVDVTKNDIDYSNINTSSINTSSHSHSISVIHISLEAVREPLIFTVVVLLAGLSKIGKDTVFLCEFTLFYL